MHGYLGTIRGDLVAQAVEKGLPDLKKAVLSELPEWDTRKTSGP